MLVRRLTTLLAAVLAVLGLSALPTASLARSSAPASPQVVEDPSQTDEGGEVDEEIDVTDEFDEFSDDELLDDELDVCDLDEELDDEEDLGDDEEILDEEDAADLRETSADDEEPVDEEDLGDDEEIFEDDIACDEEPFDEDGIFDGLDDDDDEADLGKKGSFSNTYNMPDAGDIVVDVETAGGTSRAATIAKVRLLGSKHVTVQKAGRVAVRVKLSKKGRSFVRAAKRKLRLVVRTHISLASGQEVDRTRTLNIKPAKKKHRKPGRKGKRS